MISTFISLLPTHQLHTMNTAINYSKQWSEEVWLMGPSTEMQKVQNAKDCINSLAAEQANINS